MHSNTAREGCDPGGAFSPANQNAAGFPHVFYVIAGLGLGLGLLIGGLLLGAR